jgi:hypothetical protein
MDYCLRLFEAYAVTGSPEGRSPSGTKALFTKPAVSSTGLLKLHHL